MLFLSLFRVSGHSMLPTFKPGQILLVSSIPYLFQKPKIGDVVVIKDPRSGKLLLKRIAKVISLSSRAREARRGDPVEIAASSPEASPRNDNVRYFISGDNPKDSMDSGVFGAVKKKNIFGKILKI